MMLKLMKKSLPTILSLAVALVLFTTTCFANDGMPVLQFEHDSYVGTAGSNVVVGAHVTNPDDSSPMKGVKVTFTLKDCNGKETSLPSQKSGADGSVSCEVKLGDAFPYTVVGSASDGVNLTECKIKSDGQSAKKTEKKTEKKDSALDNLSALIIILIGVIVIATIIIVVAVKKKKKNEYEGKH